jgi:transposase
MSTTPQEWHEYNLAQTNEKSRFQELLYSLCQGIEEPEAQRTGRPRIPLADMLFAVVLKVYCGFSTRRTASDLRDALQRGYLSRAPHFNSLSNYMEAEWLTAYLHAMITESALPLRTIEFDFAVDSSGFATNTYSRWHDAKWGNGSLTNESVKKQNWLKAHVMCGVKTNVVTSCTITDRRGADSPQFAGLVNATAENFVLNEVSADKAYSSHANLKLVTSKAATPYIDFKESSKPDLKDALWTRLYHFYAFNQAWFKSHYHKRSNVETVFSMIKAKFGSSLRGKSYQAQENELLCKILCHNICCLIQSIYELGIEPTFWTE